MAGHAAFEKALDDGAGGDAGWIDRRLRRDAVDVHDADQRRARTRDRDALEPRRIGSRERHGILKMDVALRRAARDQAGEKRRRDAGLAEAALLRIEAR